MQLHWSVNFDKCIDSTPSLVHAGQYIIVGSHSHQLKTLDATNGLVISNLILPDRIECQAAIVNNMPNMALIGCYDGYLYAFDYMKGAIAWRFQVGGMIKAKPLVLDTQQSVIVGSYCKQNNLKCICLQVIVQRLFKNYLN